MYEQLAKAKPASDLKKYLFQVNVIFFEFQSLNIVKSRDFLIGGRPWSDSFLERLGSLR